MGTWPQHGMRATALSHLHAQGRGWAGFASDGTVSRGDILHAVQACVDLVLTTDCMLNTHCNCGLACSRHYGITVMPLTYFTPHWPLQIFYTRKEMWDRVAANKKEREEWYQKSLGFWDEQVRGPQQ